MLAVIINDGRATRAMWAGKSNYQVIEAKDFLPDYLEERKQLNSNKTIEEQQKEFSAFHGKLKSMAGK